MSGRLSKNQAKKAGEFLAGCADPFGNDASPARLVVDEWREAHKEVFLKVPEILKISRMLSTRAPLSSAGSKEWTPLSGSLGARG